jgi:hypothetical protein
VDLTKRSDVALMRKRLPASQSRRADGLCSVTLLVPESCAEGLRDLARVLRGRQRERTAAPPFGWRRISPSAELMVDPQSGARCAVRETRAQGAERYHWTVAVVGMPDLIATGRTSDVAAARSEAEAALGAYSTDRRDQLGKRNGTDG